MSAAAGKDSEKTSGGQKSDSTDEEVRGMLEECEGYDYVRFTMCSITGEPYVKAIPARHLRKFLKDGATFWEGMAMLGTGCDIFPKMFEIVATNNIPLKPMPGTAHPLPWATRGKHKVGEILCEQMYSSGEYLPANARSVARQQLQRLHDSAGGLRLRSGSEMEFMLFHADTIQPVSRGPAYATASGHAQLEDFMYSADKQLMQSGVNLENLLEETSPGQLEFVLTPSEGIDQADQVFKFKQAIREIAVQDGMSATFMTMPFDGVGNGTHFNHSILDRTGKNMFYDGTKPDNLSAFARHWIGGLLKHAKALCALCCPTVNCYRRIGAPWSPEKANWGIDDRLTSLRVKNSCPEYTYMENRLPSGAANPYLVMAATIAAGLDGVENSIECPPAASKDTSEEQLPRTLQQAVTDLKEDAVLCKALGDTFIKWFVHEKEGSQFPAFPNWSAEDKSDTQLAKERDFYLKYI